MSLGLDGAKWDTSNAVSSIFSFLLFPPLPDIQADFLFLFFAVTFKYITATRDARMFLNGGPVSMEWEISSSVEKQIGEGWVVSPAPLKFIIHLHSPKHTLSSPV